MFKSLVNLTTLVMLIQVILAASADLSAQRKYFQEELKDLRQQYAKLYGYSKFTGRAYKSCAEYKSMTGETRDGEYKLQLQYPTCKKSVNVYCAGMNTNNPKEYITLKAGAQRNFAIRDYIGSVNNHQNRKTSTITLFEKIRINTNLSVVRDDFQFANPIWYYKTKTFANYASGRDCSTWACKATKKGRFMMDLTGTGLEFVTPIQWIYKGYPAHCSNGFKPSDYNEGSLVVHGNCGGYCGQCEAKNLKLKIQGCLKAPPFVTFCNLLQL